MEPSSTIDLHTGSRMPVLALGTWQLIDHTTDTVEFALELGYRMIDTSGDYGTQPGIAEALRRSDIDRDEVYIVTKVEEDEDAYESTRRNIGELGIDHADLMLIHRPPDHGAGEGLWEGLLQARDEGLTTDIGVSNYSITQIETLIADSGEVPAVNQIEWSPFGWDRAMLDYCRQQKIVIQAYSPLTRAVRLHEEELADIAAGYGKSPAQLLIRWNLQRGTVPLPKANQRRHLRENLNVFDFAIDDTDMQRLELLNEHYSALGPQLEYAAG